MTFPDDFQPVSYFSFPNVRRGEGVSNIGGIFAYIKVGLVFLTLYCIERKIGFPGSNRVQLLFATAFFLFSQLRLCWQYCLQSKEALSKESVSFMWE